MPAAPCAPRARALARRVARWAGLLLFVLIAAVGAASIRWRIDRLQWSTTSPGYVVSLLSISNGLFRFTGYLEAELGTRPHASDWSVRRVDPAIEWRPWWNRQPHGLDFALPLWIPLTLLGIPTAILWRNDLLAARRRRAGQCLTCGYDRRGLNPRAACPECGHVTNSPTPSEGR